MKAFITYESRGKKGFMIGCEGELHIHLAMKAQKQGLSPTGGGFYQRYAQGEEIFFGESGTIGPFDPEAVPTQMA
jgi:hypothetical protein